MRKTKLFFALVSFMLCVCANAEIIKSGSCGKNVTYTLDDSGLLVIEGSGEMADYQYFINDAPWYSKKLSIKHVEIKNGVTSIGDEAFRGCSGLTSIIIPNSVTSIGDEAFYECSRLTSVIIPNSVKSIGLQAFCECSGLTSITIPNSVTSIGDEAFWGCSGLTSMTIPNSVTYIGEKAFAKCSGLASLSVESGNTEYDSRDNCNAIIKTKMNILIAGCCNSTIPNSVKIIGNGAFSGCSGLTSIIIPNSVTSIGEYAFSGCSGLTSITIPNSVTYIARGVFYGCSGLTSITIPNSVILVRELAFAYCSKLTSMNVESGNTEYDSRDNCNAIIETKTNKLIIGCCNTVIPNSVTSIVDYAFYGCSGLTSITIPNSVTNIGFGAFQGCSGLTSITIPSSMASIGSLALKDCSNISRFYCNATTPPTAYLYSFMGMNYDSTILYVPKGTKNDYASSTYWGDFQNIVEMEDNEEDQKYLVITKKDGEVIKIPMEEIESITPKQAEPGDVDGNGEVNVADLTKLIDMLLKK